jgi:hypothetical protein
VTTRKWAGGDRGRVITISLSEFPPRTNTPHGTFKRQSALENLALSHCHRLANVRMYVPHFSTRLRIGINAFRKATRYSLVEIFTTLRRNFVSITRIDDLIHQPWLLESLLFNKFDIQSDEKVPVHLTTTVQKHAKIFKTVSITCHDNVVRIRDKRWRYGVSVSLVSPWPWRSAAKQSDWANYWGKKDIYCNYQGHRDYLITLYFY